MKAKNVYDTFSVTSDVGTGKHAYASAWMATELTSPK